MVSVLYASITLLFGRVTAEYRIDDAFITYRYSWNLAHHGEFVYNLGERVLSTTSPLNALMLTPIAMVCERSQLPIFARAMSLSFAFLTALTAYLFVSRREGTYWGLCLSVPFITLSYVYNYAGLETNLFVCLVIFAILTFVSERYFVSGLLSAFAFLARGDSALLLMIFSVYLYLFETEKPLRATLMRMVKGAAIVALPWFLFAYLYFGALFPSTLATKIFYGRTRMFAWTMLEAMIAYWGPDMLSRFRALNIFTFVLSASFILYVAGHLCRKRRKFERETLSLFFLVCFGFLQASTYALLGVGHTPWYSVPLLLACVLGTVGAFLTLAKKGMGSGSRALHRMTSLTGKVLGGAMVSVVILVNLSQTLVPPPWTGSLEDTYIAVAQLLNENTAVTDIVGLGETGIIGYYLDRKVFDYYGVISPSWIAEFSKQFPNEWWRPMQYALDKNKPQYVVGRYPFYSFDTFEAAYEPIVLFDPNYADWKLAIYKQR